ncbi:uncharacterized protein [Choristoneura fumiferana]|uniref:uncharacterized protein n=1 Tax=Choristoneura fumiferana TaxID=7141 RepID=UPI003D155F98
MMSRACLNARQWRRGRMRAACAGAAPAPAGGTRTLTPTTTATVLVLPTLLPKGREARRAVCTGRAGAAPRARPAGRLSGGLNGSDGHSVYTPVPADISSLIDKYQQRKEQERRECTIHV